MKFYLGVSNKKYTIKPQKFNGIIYNKTELTPTGLYSLILKGHLFAHNFCDFNSFFATQKKNENFSFTNVIAIDIDKCPFNFNEIQSHLKIKPLISYTTFTNTNTVYKFRLIYLIKETITTPEEYKQRIKLLLNIIFEQTFLKQIEKSIDKHAFSTHQPFLGTSNDCESIFNPDQIISIELLKNILNEDLNTYQQFENKYILNQFKTNKTECHVFSSLEEEEEKRIIYKNRKKQTVSIQNAYKLLNNAGFKPIVNNFNKAVLSNDSDNVYTNVKDQHIYALNTFFGKKRFVPEGSRYYALCRYAAIMLNINPNIRADVMLSNLIWFRNYYCENGTQMSDQELVRIVYNAFSNTNNTSNIGRKSYLINPDKKGLNIEEKRKELGKAKRKYRDDKILSVYDSNLNVHENKECCGYHISTIYKCLKDNGISTKNDDEFNHFRDVYYQQEESNRSVRKMINHGFTKWKCEKFIKRIKNENR